MDFMKFFSLVKTRKLYFSSAWQLLKDDPFEGSLNIFHAKFAGVGEIGDGKYKTWFTERNAVPEGWTKETWNRFNETDIEKRKEIRRFTYINSWHMSDHESAAMWKIYDRSNHGLAVVSTFKRLCQSVSYERPIHIGTVTYIDRDTDEKWLGNLFDPFMHKSNFFSYENEVRAMLTDHLELMNPVLEKSEHLRSAPPAGVSVNCDLKTLIIRVVVSPSAPSWTVELIKNYCAEALGEEALSSSLTSEPYF